MTELLQKSARLGALMAERGLGALLLTRSANIAWLTGGARTYIDTATDGGVASVLVLPDRMLVVTSNIEAARLRDEEPLSGFEIVSSPWHSPADEIARRTRGLVLGTDSDTDVTPLRAPLLPAEVERYRELGRDVGAALLRIAEGIEPGATEHLVAGRIAREIYDIGAVPVVVQVAADERAWRYRHALPTDAPVQRSVLWGLCARRHGLIVSASRVVAFGAVPPDLVERVAAVGAIEAAAVAATRPGVALGTIFGRIARAYADAGFPDEWENHHQGGPCSYAARDALARPDSEERVSTVQAFAWNPTVPGAKSEDTVLCTGAGCERLTHSSGWPQRDGSNDLLRR